MKKSSQLSKILHKKVLLLLFPILISVLSCNSKKNTESEIKYHLFLGRLATLTQSPTVTIAWQNKYFEKYGLSVDFQTLGNNVTEPVSLGKVDAIFQGLAKEIVLGANDTELTFFAGTQSGGVYVAAHKDNAERLKNPENWKGLTVGAIQLTTSDIALKDYTSHKLNYKIGEDITFKAIEDKPSIALGIGKKTLDIGVVDPEFVPILEANGGQVIACVTDFIPDNVCCRQIAYTPHFKANREAYKAFLKAQIVAYKDFKLNVDESIKTLAKAYEQDDDYVITMIYDKKQNANRGYNPDPNYNGVLGVYTTLSDLGYIDKSNSRPLYDYFDISVYADSLKEVIAEYPNDEFFKSLWEYFASHNNEHPDFNKFYL